MRLSPYETVLTQGLEEIDKTQITPRQWQVLHHLRDCRTERMGSYEWHCGHCGHDVTWYCSCRDRHCPSCQAQMREKWLQKRRQDLLPVAYHHIVFTLPHEFNALIRAYPKVIYRCLFHSVWSTLKAFANERHHLSGQLGALMVLHTWGRNLSQDVHLHCLVPSGVLTKEHQWLATRKAAYLFPVKALSVRFKKVMLSSVRGEVTTHHDLLIKTAQKSWVVYSKPVLNKTETVINSLSKYCNRIGLNPDQLHHDNNKLRLDYKDYRTAGSTSLVCSAGEILRRLLLHVLLKGLMRIRYYGFMANAVRVKLVKLIWASLQAHPLIADKVIEKLPPTCPSCGFAEMVMTRINLRPDAFSSA